MLQFTYKLKITERSKQCAAAIPATPPSKDGRAGIHGDFDELVIREQEFHKLQEQILSFGATAPPVDVIVPVVVAIVECQLRIHQLQEFLISPARKLPWLMFGTF